MKRLAAAVVAAAALAHADAVYFSPRGGCEEALVAAIAAAEESIDVAMYSFTNDRLADALIAAARRGVRVRVLLDEEQLTSKNIQGPRLAANGVEVRIINPDPGVFHLKLALFDKNIIAIGSYNWTKSAEKYNNEVLKIYTNPAEATVFSNVFENFWGNTAPLKNEFTENYYLTAGPENLLHRLGCPFAPVKPPYEWIILNDPKAAESLELEPCEFCKPLINLAGGN